MSDISCPKCGCEHEPLDAPDDNACEWECEQCGFRFVVEVEIEPIYTVTCKVHNWGEWRDTVYEVDRWRVCLICAAMETRSNDERDKAE